MLSKFACHLHNDMLVKLRPRRSVAVITVRVNTLGLASPCLLLFTVDLHDIVYNVEVIIDCVSARENVLRCDGRLCRMSPRRLEWSSFLMWIGALLVLTSNHFLEEVIVLGDMLVVLVTMVHVRL